MRRLPWWRPAVLRPTDTVPRGCWPTYVEAESAVFRDSKKLGKIVFKILKWRRLQCRIKRDGVLDCYSSLLKLRKQSNILEQNVILDYDWRDGVKKIKKIRQHIHVHLSNISVKGYVWGIPAQKRNKECLKSPPRHTQQAEMPQASSHKKKNLPAQPTGSVSLIKPANKNGL